MTVGATAVVGEGVTVAHDAVIGAGAIVGDGVRIGASAVIGMGAVVTHDVPPRATWVGVPARSLHAIVTEAGS